MILFWFGRQTEKIFFSKNSVVRIKRVFKLDGIEFKCDRRNRKSVHQVGLQLVSTGLES